LKIETVSLILIAEKDIIKWPFDGRSKKGKELTIKELIMRKECGKGRQKKTSEGNKKAQYSKPAIETEKEINVVIGGCGDASKTAKLAGSCEPGTQNINS